MSDSTGRRSTLITGGAGFIGTNVADRLLTEGNSVIILDNLARPGVEQNLAWLQAKHGKRVHVERADVRDSVAVRRAVSAADRVFHFAAQVAVTTSLGDPREDFDINAGGTLTLLEAVRAQSRMIPLVFTSTNKVYGALPDVTLTQTPVRYAPLNPSIARFGVSETRALDFHSPYGCSKGAADQYVIDYARTFGLHTAVFRMSCIYGPHQRGTEDQGWVAHFMLQAMRGQPITIYGDGKQVRDILFVEDLVDALLRASRALPRLSGCAFNIGGGPGNAVSLLEVLDLLRELGETPRVEFANWRPGDQRYYVSDTRAFEQATGWRPRVRAAEGLSLLMSWLTTSAASRDSEAASTLAVAR